METDRKKKGGVRIFRLHNDHKTMEFKRIGSQIAVKVFDDKKEDTLFYHHLEVDDLFDLSLYITKVLEQNYFAALVNFNRSYERFEKATRKVLDSV